MMQKGIIKMLNPVKEFGFITTEEDDDLYFSYRDMHPKSRNTRLHEGMQVGFDMKREIRGDRAVNVRVL